MRQNRQCIVVLVFLANDGGKNTNGGHWPSRWQGGKFVNGIWSATTVARTEGLGIPNETDFDGGGAAWTTPAVFWGRVARVWLRLF